MRLILRNEIFDTCQYTCTRYFIINFVTFKRNVYFITHIHRVVCTLLELKMHGASFFLHHISRRLKGIIIYSAFLSCCGVL